MKHCIFPVAVIICLLAVAWPGRCGEPLVTRMGNGLTLITDEDHATDLVGIAVWIKAGSGSESAANNGVSHLIEHMVFGATAKRKPGDMDLEIESVGSTLDAYTSRDWVRLTTTISSRYLPKALDILADAVSGAQFGEADVAREKLVIKDEIAKKDSNPFKFCADLLAKELYGSHPYALPVEGTKNSIAKISRSDIIDYYHKYFVPGNMAVVLVGDVDAQRAVTEVGQAFQRAASDPPPEYPLVEAVALTQQVNKPINAPFKNDYLAIGFLGPPGSAQNDVCATDVMLTYLGFGYRSWMETELKGKLALASEVQADFLTQRNQGLISLIAATTSGSLAQAKEAILTRIAGLRSTGLSVADIEMAKRVILGQNAFQDETVAGRATSYGFYFAVTDSQFGAKYPTCLQAVTNEDIIRVARKYLDPDKAVVLFVGPDQGGSN